MRIFLLKTFFLLVFFSIILRLFYWQIVKAEYLQSQAENQHFTNIKVDALRGNILFGDRFILSSSNPSFTVFAQPKLIPKDEKTKENEAWACTHHLMTVYHPFRYQVLKMVGCGYIGSGLFEIR